MDERGAGSGKRKYRDKLKEEITVVLVTSGLVGVVNYSVTSRQSFIDDVAELKYTWHALIRQCPP